MRRILFEKKVSDKEKQKKIDKRERKLAQQRAAYHRHKQSLKIARAARGAKFRVWNGMNERLWEAVERELDRLNKRTIFGNITEWEYSERMLFLMEIAN